VWNARKGLVALAVIVVLRIWTMDSGTWSQTGPADGVLSPHQAGSAA
jgi:hypothetical protein